MKGKLKFKLMKPFRWEDSHYPLQADKHTLYHYNSDKIWEKWRTSVSLDLNWLYTENQFWPFSLLTFSLLMFANFSACSEKCSISTDSCSIHMRTDIALINTRAFAANSRSHRVYWGVGAKGGKESQECGQILRKPAIYTLKFRWPPHPFGSSALTVDVVVQMIGSMVVSKLTAFTILANREPRAELSSRWQTNLL